MNTDSIKIIIIDDEPDLCFLLSGMLTSYGYKVTYFHTLQSGIDGAVSGRPDWVIIDNNLPDGLGWEGANEILKTHEHTHIIKISANPDSPRTDNRYNIHYLIKPIKVQSIVDLIHQNQE
jgi:DNA-binding response OmpR family regulator